MANSPTFTLRTQKFAVEAYTAQLNDLEVAIQKDQEFPWSAHQTRFEILLSKLNALPKQVGALKSKDAQSLKERFRQLQMNFAKGCVDRLGERVVTFSRVPYQHDPASCYKEYDNINWRRERLQREIALLSAYDAPLLLNNLRNIERSFSQTIVQINIKLEMFDLRLNRDTVYMFQLSGQNWLFSDKTQRICGLFFSSQINDLNRDVTSNPDCQILPHIRRIEILRTELNQQMSHSMEGHLKDLQDMQQRLDQIKIDLFARSIAFIKEGLKEVDGNFDQWAQPKTLSRALMDLGVKINQLNLVLPPDMKKSIAALKKERTRLKQREIVSRLRAREALLKQHKPIEKVALQSTQLKRGKVVQLSTPRLSSTSPVLPSTPPNSPRFVTKSAVVSSSSSTFSLFNTPLPSPPHFMSVAPLPLNSMSLEEIWTTINYLQVISTRLNAEQMIHDLTQDSLFALYVTFAMSNRASSVLDRVFFHLGTAKQTSDMIRRAIQRTRIELFCIAFIETIKIKGGSSATDKFSRYFREMNISLDYQSYYLSRLLVNPDKDEAAKKAIVHVLASLKREWGC